jgi:hypothetical protein
LSSDTDTWRQSMPDLLVRVQVLRKEYFDLGFVVGQLCGRDGDYIRVRVASVGADLCQLRVRGVTALRKSSQAKPRYQTIGIDLLIGIQVPIEHAKFC